MSTVDKLKVSLANHITGALDIWGFHWNIEGSNARQYHDIFGEVYKSLLSQADAIAELIRATSHANEYSIVSPEILQQDRTTKSAFIVGSKSQEMMTATLEILTNIKNELSEILELATTEKEHAVSNYCATQIEKLSTTIWMILAITKEEK